MNLVSKSMLAVVAGTMVLASAAFGEDVKAVKVSPIKAALPDSYGRVEMRHYANFNITKDELKNTTPKAQVRAALGSTFFDGKLMSEVIVGGTKTTETASVGQRRPQIYTEVEALSGTYGSINPYLDLYVPFKGSGTDATLSFDSSLKVPTIELAAGMLDLSTGFDPAASLSSRAVKTSKVDTATSRESKFLTTSATGDQEVVQKEPSVSGTFRASVAFKPAAVAGLSLSGTTYLGRSFDPKYEISEEGGDGTVQTKTGYVTENLTSQLVAVSYKIGNGLSITNETWHKMNGFYEARYDGGPGADGLSRVTNIVKLKYTLF